MIQKCFPISRLTFVVGLIIAVYLCTSLSLYTNLFAGATENSYQSSLKATEALKSETQDTLSKSSVLPTHQFTMYDLTCTHGTLDRSYTCLNKKFNNAVYFMTTTYPEVDYPSLPLPNISLYEPTPSTCTFMLGGRNVTTVKHWGDIFVYNSNGMKLSKFRDENLAKIYVEMFKKLLVTTACQSFLIVEDDAVPMTSTEPIYRMITWLDTTDVPFYSFDQNGRTYQFNTFTTAFYITREFLETITPRLDEFYSAGYEEPKGIDIWLHDNYRLYRHPKGMAKQVLKSVRLSQKLYHKRDKVKINRTEAEMEMLIAEGENEE